MWSWQYSIATDALFLFHSLDISPQSLLCLSSCAPRQLRHSQRLTSISRHKFVALRFLSRAGYAKTSTLRITPEPESVVRALLVFCGVQSDEVELWPRAKARGCAACDGSWSAVVGAVEGRNSVGGGMNAVEMSWVEVFQDDV